MTGPDFDPPPHADAQTRADFQRLIARALAIGARDTAAALARAMTPVYPYRAGTHLSTAPPVGLRRYPRAKAFALANTAEIAHGRPPLALLAGEDAARSRAYRSLVAAIGIEPETDVVGLAEAMSRSPPDRAAPQIHDHRPGRAVAYYTGHAGTLGLYVRARLSPGLVGFTSSAHVLQWDVRGSAGSPILSPAPPPESLRNDRNTYGRYEAGRFLVPYTHGPHSCGQNGGEIPLNTADIAFARLERPAEAPDGNLVPDPEAPHRLRRLTGVLGRDEIMARLARRNVEPFEVWKIGRASGLTAGVLYAASGTPQPVTHRGASYLYADYCVVKPEPPHPRFSAGGDSGAVVYTRDIKVVGFVVAQTSAGRTLLHVAAECLQALELEALL